MIASQEEIELHQHFFAASGVNVNTGASHFIKCKRAVGIEGGSSVCVNRNKFTNCGSGEDGCVIYAENGSSFTTRIIDHNTYEVQSTGIWGNDTQNLEKKPSLNPNEISIIIQNGKDFMTERIFTLDQTSTASLPKNQQYLGILIEGTDNIGSLICMDGMKFGIDKFQNGGSYASPSTAHDLVNGVTYEKVSPDYVGESGTCTAKISIYEMHHTYDQK